MTTFGSTTEDQDGVPRDYDRGPKSEDRLSENELRGQMQTIAKAKMSMGEIATLESAMVEMQVLRDLVDQTLEQNNKLVGLVATLRAEFEQYRKQRAVELQSWLANGGSTTPEDMNGTQS